MNKKLISGLLILLSLTCVFAENAKIAYIKGKVEIQKNNAWVPAEVGDILQESETISTGFLSEVKIEYLDSAIILGQVSRITIDEMSVLENKHNVSLYLHAGSVKSEITKSKENPVVYKVETPVSVASELKSDFMITSAGYVFCKKGTGIVSFYKKSDKKSNTKTPSGVVLVGRNKKVTIKTDGTIETPMVRAVMETEQVKNSITTAAIKEKENAGGAVSNIAVSVVLED